MSTVVFVDRRVTESFSRLKNGKFEDKRLHEFISRALSDLKSNPFIGIEIPKKQIPKEYIKRHGVNNLRKYNLPNAWRLLYSIEANSVEIISIILEWLDHKNYERMFGY